MNRILTRKKRLAVKVRIVCVRVCVEGQCSKCTDTKFLTLVAQFYFIRSAVTKIIGFADSG